MRNILTITMALAFAQVCIAKEQIAQVRSIGVEVEKPSIVTKEGRFASDGTILAVYQANFKSALRTNLPADAETAAREYLSFLAPRLGLENQQYLEKTFAQIDPQISVVRFQQIHQGLPVYESDTAVTMDAHGNVIFLANGIKAKLAIIPSTVQWSADQAIAMTQSWAGAKAAYLKRAELMIFASTSGTKLVWRVVFVPSENIGVHYETLVDAQSGQILRAQDKTLNIDGAGMAFDPDPLSSAQVNYAAGYVDGGDVDTPELIAQIKPVALRDIRAVSGGFDLVGPYAACSSHSAPNPAGECTISPTTDFYVASRSDNRFEVSNVYYHIDTYMRYMNSTLGISVTPSQYAGGVKFDPHGLNDADNSSFSGATGFLQFGDGGVDDAEDADVIVHELGHGLHYWLTNGGLSNASGDGLSEGSGDYAAMSYSRGFDHWASAAPQYFWMFSWDGHNPFWGGRVTNYNLAVSWPNIGTSGPHTPGQYWASCNMLNYNSIGRLKSDRAFWRGLAATNASTRQNDAAQAVLNVAAALNYSNPELSAMHSNFTGGQAAGKCSYTVTATTNADSIYRDGFE